MPEFKAAVQWRESGRKGMANQINNQFHEDGVHNEFDPGYHIGAIADFYDVYKLAQVNGCLSDFPADFIESLRNTVNFVKDIMYPDYSIEIIRK